MDLPPHLLDKQIRKAAAAARAARDDLLHNGPGAASTQNPLEGERAVSSKATYLELSERPKDVLTDAFRAWVYALTLERVLWPDLVRFATAWHEPSIEVEEAERARLSPRTLLERVLAEPAPERRRTWAEALARGGGRAADAAHILADRRAEAIRRLGVEEPDTIEIPTDPPDAARAAAERLLTLTEPMLDRRGPTWDDAVARSLARGATAGWPARITARWIEELPWPAALTEGLSIHLGPLPAPLGATSFTRALARFGRVFAEAAIPEAAPFVLARPPFDLRVARRSALFGGLLADPVFGARALGLGKDRAREQARVIARGLLLTLRQGAARVLLRGTLVLPPAARGDRFEEETARALGAPIPASLAGVVPRLEPHDAVALVGAILAARDRRDLVDRFDEDWFRSPHAARALREEQSVLPASPRAPAEAIGGDGASALTALARDLEDLLA